MKLVAERAKYEKFLAELDKDPGSKPANVVARVRADYTTKLQGVVAELKENHDVLTGHAATLTTQLQKLQEAEQRLRDELAELDLRKEVGELPEEEWISAADRVKADAGKIKQQQEVTSGDIKRIRDMLASLAPAPVAKPEPAAPAVDEMAFLKAVVGPSAGAPPAPTRTSEPRTSAPTPAPRPSTVLKPLGPPPRASAPTPRATISKPVERLIEPDPMSVEAAPVIVSESAAPAPKPTPKSEALIDAPQADVAITAKGAGEAKPMAANVPTGDLNLKALGFSPAQKKAKCPKCGGLNVPSDWYCVHCGAELAI